VVRKKGVGLLAGIATLILLLIFLFRDSLIERTMNRAGSSIVGAKVEFHGVHYSILKSILTWKTLQVTNPLDTRYNLFETGTSTLNIRVEPLIYKRYIFEKGRFDSLRFNTIRKSSGSLYKFKNLTNIAPYYDSIAVQLENKLQEFSQFNPQRLKSLNVDSIMNIAHIKTPAKIDSLKTTVEQKSKDWNKQISTLPDYGVFSGVQKKIDSIDIDQIKTIPQFATAINTLRLINKKIDSLRSVIDSVNNILNYEITQIKRYDTLVSGWITDNYQTLLLLAHLPEITRENAAEVFFGPAVIKNIQSAIPYFGMARWYSEKARALLPDKKTNLPRRMGQNIPFPDNRGWPQLWIQDLVLNGKLFQNINAEGVANNIVTQQKLIGLPTTIELSAAQLRGASLSLKGLFNYLGEISLERFGLEANKVSLDSVDFQSELIPLKLIKGLGDISGSIQSQGRSFEAQAGFFGTNLLFDLTNHGYEKIDPQILILRDSLIHSINQLSITAITKMIGMVLTLDIASYIAEKIAELMKKIPIQAIETARSKLHEKLDNLVGPKRKELQRTINQRIEAVKDSLTFKNEYLKKLAQTEMEKSKELEGLPFGFH
jgi:uncharacterized protein (TIGR03545 family)